MTIARVVCVLCRRERDALTREHVFARWLTQRVGTAGAARVIASVCAECNAGWMSSLEVGFRRLLTGPRSGPIAPPDRITLARWFTKTAVLIAHANGAALIPPAENRALEEGMPAGVTVSLARRRRPRERLAFTLDGGVTLHVDDLAAHVAPGRAAWGTRLWPLRSHVLRWDTLPVA